MTPTEAFNKLKQSINIQHYIGPNLTKIIKDACIEQSKPKGEEAILEITEPSGVEKIAPDTEKNTSIPKVASNNKTESK